MGGDVKWMQNPVMSLIVCWEIIDPLQQNEWYNLPSHLNGTKPLPPTETKYISLAPWWWITYEVNIISGIVCD